MHSKSHYKRVKFSFWMSPHYDTALDILTEKTYVLIHLI